MSKFRVCKAHDECRHVAGHGGIFEIVKCPWCGYSVSTSNPGNWCANCYCLFELSNGRVHFGQKLPVSLGQAIAIGMAKMGGVKMAHIDKGDS